MRKKTKQKLTYEIAEKLLESFDFYLEDAENTLAKEGYTAIENMSLKEYREIRHVFRLALWDKTWRKDWNKFETYS